MLFTNDIVLVDENLNVINCKLKLRRRSLETKSFRLSRIKIKFMICNFSNTKNR